MKRLVWHLSACPKNLGNISHDADNDQSNENQDDGWDKTRVILMKLTLDENPRWGMSKYLRFSQVRQKITIHFVMVVVVIFFIILFKCCKRLFNSLLWTTFTKWPIPKSQKKSRTQHFDDTVYMSTNVWGSIFTKEVLKAKVYKRTRHGRKKFSQPESLK